MGEVTSDHRPADDLGDVSGLTEITVTLRSADDRLRALARRSMRRVLDGSADRQAMEEADSGRRGEVGAAGVDALRRALRAEGMDDATVSRIEGLYLNAMMGV